MGWWSEPWPVDPYLPASRFWCASCDWEAEGRDFSGPCPSCGSAYTSYEPICDEGEADGDDEADEGESEKSTPAEA